MSKSLESTVIFPFVSCGDFLKVLKLAGHLGSCIYDPEVYTSMGEIMAGMIGELERRGHTVQVLNIGGGIGIDYYQQVEGIQDYMAPSIPLKREVGVPALGDFVKVIADHVPKNVTLILEPGRSLVKATPTFQKLSTCHVIIHIPKIRWEIRVWFFANYWERKRPPQNAMLWWTPRWRK